MLTAQRDRTEKAGPGMLDLGKHRTVDEAIERVRAKP